MNKPSVPLMLSSFEKQRVINIANDLIRFESDSILCKEGPIGDYIASFLERVGVLVERQYCAPDRYNVIARIPGSDHSRCIMYCGHMDVVSPGEASQWTSPAYTPEIREDKLFGRGSCDMKGSIACTLFMAEYYMLHSIIPKNDILLVYDIDEENTNLGLKKYFEHPDKVNFVIVGEPSCLAIDIGHRGVMAFTIEVYGKNAHAGKAKLGINAINVMMEITNEINLLQAQLDEIYQEYLGAPSVYVTQIWGGEKVNMIPGKTTIRVDRRLVDGESSESCTAQLEKITSTICEKHNCTYSISVTTYCPPGRIDGFHPQVRMMQSVLKASGMDFELSAFEASCEAGLIKEQLGIPVVIFGPGDISQAHKPDEYISLEQLYRGAELYTTLFSNFSY